MDELMVSIISSYLVPSIGLTFLLVLTLINPVFNKTQNKFFLLAIVVNLALIVTTALDAIFALQHVGNMWIFRRMTSFINFAASPIIPICLVRIFSDKHYKIGFYIPIILNTVVCFVSMFGKLVFYISPNNAYDRGVLMFLPFAVSFFYIMILALKPAIEHKQSKKLEAYFLLSVVIIMIASMALEVLAYIKFLNWSCISICLIIYYLIINIHTYVVDPLTGVYNRLRYNRDMIRLQHSSDCVLGLLDINDFKTLNDKEGHIAGDECLKKIAEALEENLGQGIKVYRIGGDEFVFISTGHNIETCRAKLKAAQAELSKSNISFSAGVLEYKLQHNIFNVIKEADRLMYEDKKRYKSKNTNA